MGFNAVNLMWISESKTITVFFAPIPQDSKLAKLCRDFIRNPK